jgi:hypothetical protein
MENIKPDNEILEFPITFESENQSPIQTDFRENEVPMSSQNNFEVWFFSFIVV